MNPSPNVADLQGSATLAVASLCKQLRAQGRNVLDLSAGEPDFRTPNFAAEAGIAAIEQGFTHYTPVPGTPQLRDAIASYLSTATGKRVDAAGVVVSNGAKQALFNACFSLFGPGDEVLVPVPYWTSYPEILKLARATPMLVPSTEEAGFKITVADLEKAATAATRGIILNSPSNPTGIVYSLEELDALVRWAHNRGLWIISDEIYGRLCFNAERAASILDLDDSLLERSVLIDGASKAFAMTGWRIGFSYCSTALARTINDLQSHVTSGAATPSQYAALAVFRHEPRVQESVNAMVRLFKRRRDRLVAAMTEQVPRATFVSPDGAFYLFFRVDAYFASGRQGSAEFCSWLLEKTGVALVPGIAFGDDRYVRLSFAAPEAEVLGAVERIASALT
ncbi:MAG: pyridoxal phosphate-dependent aminotransferase [Longimicrobiales bacterium]